tara:strand:+ start:225 stop:401 length:177 start_codon:yes stop_codon:yes gene_type:complete
MPVVQLLQELILLATPVPCVPAAHAVHEMLDVFSSQNPIGQSLHTPNPRLSAYPGTSV